MQHPRFTLAPLTLALWLALAGPAQAQPAAPDARIQATLPAQPLGQSLNALARQAGLDLIAGGALVQGLTAPAARNQIMSGTITCSASSRWHDADRPLPIDGKEAA